MCNMWKNIISCDTCWPSTLLLGSLRRQQQRLRQILDTQMTAAWQDDHESSHQTKVCWKYLEVKVGICCNILDKRGAMATLKGTELLTAICGGLHHCTIIIACAHPASSSPWACHAVEFIEGSCIQSESPSAMCCAQDRLVASLFHLQWRLVGDLLFQSEHIYNYRWFDSMTVYKQSPWNHSSTHHYCLSRGIWCVEWFVICGNSFVALQLLLSRFPLAKKQGTN